MLRLLQYIALLLGLVAVACTNDPSLSDDGAGEALVRLRIQTPRASRPSGSTQTRAGEIDPDYKVGTVCVLVLYQDGSDYLYQYMVEADAVTQAESSSATFDATLRAIDSPVKLLVLANYPAGLADDMPAVGTTEANLRLKLTEAYSGAITTLPMCGEIMLTALSGSQTTAVTVPMMRSVARVDVTTANLDGTSSAFELQTVYLYRANDRLQLLPNTAALSDDTPPKAASPSIPATATTLSAPSAPWTVAASGDTAIGGIYLPESVAATTAAEQSTATCIVVGGVFGGDSAATYYRIDFNSGNEGHPFGQVLRNYRYTFDITKVLGSGLSDPDTAANGTATSMIANITTWNEAPEEIYFPETDEYLTLSANEVLLRWYKGSTRTFVLATTVPFDWYMDSLTPAAGTAGATQSNDDFTVSLAQTSTNGDETVYTFTVTSLADQLSDTMPFHALTIRAGIGQVQLDIVQENFLKYKDQKVNILSFGAGVGSLGDSFGTNVAASSTVQNLLMSAANFGPSGTVTIGGFTLVEEPTVGLLTSTAANDQAELKYLCSVADIVVLPYGYNPVEANCNIILDWLDASPNHVLFITFDVPGTNDTMQTTINTRYAYSPATTWTTYSPTLLNAVFTLLYGAVTGGSIQTVNSDITTVNAPILQNGAFGPVDLTVGYMSGNGTARYAYNASGLSPYMSALCEYGYVIPSGALYPTGKIYRSGAAFMGFDPTHRIVYYGDGEALGTISNAPLTLLWSNVFCWAARQVMWEE